jgi:hypothetical protein
LTDWNAFHATSDRLDTSFDFFTPLKRLFSDSPRRKLSLNKALSP